jgi:type II secretory pathway pseudopilin PulG
MRNAPYKPSGQKGYVLLSLMLLMTLMVIALAVEAPRIAQQIKREKEEELIHRGTEYKNAIRKYFRKFGRFPVSLDQLENTNNVRFLRKRYKDPFTGKDDWRLLHPGEVQVNIANGAAAIPGQPGGIGQPIGQSGSIGQPIGQPASGGFGATGSSPSPTPAPAAGQPGTDAGTGNAASATLGTPGMSATAPGSNTASGIGGTITSLSGSSAGQFGGGPIIGVASTSKLTSIKELNGKNHYNEWPFWYTPQQEQLGLAGANAGVPGGVPGGIQGQGAPGQGQIFAPGPVTSPSTPTNNPMNPPQQPPPNSPMPPNNN